MKTVQSRNPVAAVLLLALTLFVLWSGKSAAAIPYNRISNESGSISGPNTITLTATVDGGVVKLVWSFSGTVYANICVDRADDTPPSNWIQIADLGLHNLTPTKYNDTISAPYCALTSLSYRVRIVSPPLPDEFSNVVSVAAKDDTRPNDVNGLWVTIVDGKPVISWDLVTNDKIDYYEVSRSINMTNWLPITGGQAIPESLNSVIDNLDPINPCNTIYDYVIVSIDKCNNRGKPLYESTYVQTLLLNLTPPNECGHTVKVDWNAYVHMPGGLQSYQLFRKEGSGLPVKISDGPLTSYEDAYNFIDGQSYTYYVRAVNTGGSLESLSCEKSFVYQGASVPDSLYVGYVTVKNDRYVEGGYSYSPADRVKTLLVERSGDQGVSWTGVDTLRAALGSWLPSKGIFTDSTAAVGSQSYCYRLQVLDSCDNRLLSSENTACTILLSCGYTDSDNLISWTPYSTWRKGVNEYTVHQFVDGLPAGGTAVAALQPAVTTYSESASAFDPAAMVCYKVSAAEKTGNNLFPNAISESNSCCIVRKATLFMPNAFNPLGKNPVFRPVATSVDPFKFSMLIFDRWGRKIFETNDMVSGWNGTIDGEEAPPGLYTYYLKYSSLLGEESEKRGTFRLVK
jgi:gliding motility-associated-like protein